MNLHLPDFAKKLAPGERFHFACHPDAACFTVCCRDLELALTPFDVLCLKKKLSLSSTAFLHRYVSFMKEESEVLPRLYLSMENDDQANCPFVSPTGCLVYDSRPGACRSYPVGRAVSQTENGQKLELYILLSEPHCQGFGSSMNYTVEEWIHDQQLPLYNEINDEVMTLLQHKRIKQGKEFTKIEMEQFITALYDLDAFRSYVLDAKNASQIPLTSKKKQTLADDDIALLRFGIEWLKQELFGE